jgi:Activator of Hsp90 ATPase homolog 1-like protein
MSAAATDRLLGQVHRGHSALTPRLHADVRAGGGWGEEGDDELIITVTFDERGGTTHVVSHSLCPSKDVRDAIIASGMEHGMRETMDQLEELVASLQ